MKEFLVTYTDIDILFENCLSMPVYSRIEFLALSQSKSGYTEKTFLNLLLTRWCVYRSHVFSEYEKMGYEKVCEVYGFEFCLKIWDDEPDPFVYIYDLDEYEDEKLLPVGIKNDDLHLEWLNEDVLFLVRDYIYKLDAFFQEKNPQPKTQENPQTTLVQSKSETELNEIPEGIHKIIKSVSRVFANFHLQCINDEICHLPLSIQKKQLKDELMNTNTEIVQLSRDNNLNLRQPNENVLSNDFISRFIARMGQKVFNHYLYCYLSEVDFWKNNMHIKFGAPNEIAIDMPEFNLLIKYLALNLYYDKLLEINDKIENEDKIEESYFSNVLKNPISKTQNDKFNSLVNDCFSIDTLTRQIEGFSTQQERSKYIEFVIDSFNLISLSIWLHILEKQNQLNVKYGTNDFINATGTFGLYIDNPDEIPFEQTTLGMKFKMILNDFIRKCDLLVLKIKGSNEFTNEIISNQTQTTFTTESISGGASNLTFKCNGALLVEIHGHCNNDIFICSETDFVKYVQSANFSLLKIKTKSKVKRLIYYLSNKMGSVWYEETAKSLGYKKSDCSGANVSDIKWKKQLERIIPQ